MSRLPHSFPTSCLPGSLLHFSFSILFPPHFCRYSGCKSPGHTRLFLLLLPRTGLPASRTAPGQCPMLPGLMLLFSKPDEQSCNRSAHAAQRKAAFLDPRCFFQPVLQNCEDSLFCSSKSTEPDHNQLRPGQNCHTFHCLQPQCMNRPYDRAFSGSCSADFWSSDRFPPGNVPGELLLHVLTVPQPPENQTFVFLSFFAPFRI